jgi:hypothetical protein
MAPTSLAHRNATTNTLTVDYYLDGDTLIIASATTPGRLHVVTATECSCDAGRNDWPCVHADYRLHILATRPPAALITASSRS